jgi:hypothetical protein
MWSLQHKDYLKKRAMFARTALHRIDSAIHHDISIENTALVLLDTSRSCSFCSVSSNSLVSSISVYCLPGR